MIQFFSQVFVLTKLNLQNVMHRLGLYSVAILGIAAVVAVLVGVLSMAEGFKKTVVNTGRDDVALVLRGGSQAEISSSIPKSQIDAFESMAFSKGLTDSFTLSPETYLVVNVANKNSELSVNVPLRGVQPNAFKIRKDFKIIEGRMFDYGKNEILVGNAVRNQFDNLEIGSRLNIGKSMWLIVGIFEVGGNVVESELWGDSKTIQSSFKFDNVFQSLRIEMSDSNSFEQISQMIDADPRVELKVITEKTYYSKQAQGVSGFIRALGYPLAIIMGIGTLFGAPNTMHASVAERIHEIATLRVLGFKPKVVFFSTLLEGISLAVIGSLIGIIVVYVFFDGYVANTLDKETFSQVVFRLDVSYDLMKKGVVLALIIGFLGAFTPALKASRMNLSKALSSG